MANAAIDLSETLAGLAERQGPSVVRVEARHRIPSTGLVWSEDGVIVTAQHTVERDENIEIGFADESTAEATLIGRDPTTDLAVLKVDRKGLTPAAFGETDGLKVGHLVAAFGRPGRSVRATFGIVGTLGDSDGFRTPAGGRIDRYVEPAFDLPRGFSGGPLVDLSGRVLGLNTVGVLRGTTITIPTSTIRRVTEKLLAHGKLQRAYLGVGTHPVRLPPRVAQAVGQEFGLLVVSVQPDGPADKAGAFLGDVLLALDGKSLTDMSELLETLSDDRIGKALAAKIWRAGQTTELTITAGARGQ